MTNFTPESVNELLRFCSQAEAAELKVLHNAQTKCLKAYQEDPTAQKKKDFDAAKAGYQECLNHLWSVYMESDSQQVLKNRLEAVKWLQEQGYKIGKSKFYKDVDAKRVKIRDDGTILVSDLERYIKKMGLKPLSSSTSTDKKLESLHEAKLQKEIEKLEWENRKREFEYEKEMERWLPREDFELEMASRAGLLDSGLRTKIKTAAPDWVYLVGGQPDKVPDLVQAINKVLDQAMNEFARLDRFQVVFEDRDASAEKDKELKED